MSRNQSEVLVKSRTATVRVRPAAGAQMYRGTAGFVSSPSDFIVGDRVFVVGSETTQGLVEATRIGSVYDIVSFTVEAIDEETNVAATNLGPLDLGGSLPDIGRVPHTIAVGDYLNGLTWTDPSSGETYLMLTERDRIS